MIDKRLLRSPRSWIITLAMFATFGITAGPMLALQPGGAKAAPDTKTDKAAPKADEEAKKTAPETRSETFGGARLSRKLSKPLTISPVAEYLPEPMRPEREILVKLQSLVEFEYLDTPLANAVEFLKDQHKINVAVDQKALEDEGVAMDTPINLKVSGIRMQSALRHMLKPLGLTFVIEDEVLLVTTEIRAEEKLFTRTYPVGDLCVEPDNYEALIMAMTDTIDPVSWEAAGGIGSLVPVENAGSLVVRQTWNVHTKIVDLLRTLRIAADLPIPRSIEDIVGPEAKPGKTAGK